VGQKEDLPFPGEDVAEPVPPGPRKALGHEGPPGLLPLKGRQFQEEVDRVHYASGPGSASPSRMA